MRPLNIAVCAKPVPDPNYYEKVDIDPVKKTIIRTSVPTVINPADKNAVEAALKLKEAHGGIVTVFSMAPPEAEIEIRKLLAMGADEAFLVSDRTFAGSDTLATSNILASAIRQAEKNDQKKFDLILCGAESADGGTGQVVPQLGEWLSTDHLWNAVYIDSSSESDKLRIKTKTDLGFAEWLCGLPAVIGVSRDVNVPRFTSVMAVIKAKNKKLSVLTRNDIGLLDPDLTGWAGSPTKPGDLYRPRNERSGIFFEGDPEEKAHRIIEALRSRGISVRTCRDE